MTRKRKSKVKVILEERREPSSDEEAKKDLRHVGSQEQGSQIRDQFLGQTMKGTSHVKEFTTSARMEANSDDLARHETSFSASVEKNDLSHSVGKGEAVALKEEMEQNADLVILHKLETKRTRRK